MADAPTRRPRPTRRCRAGAAGDSLRRRAEAVDVHPPTRAGAAAYAAVRGLFAGLAKLYFRLEIHGRENIPPRAVRAGPGAPVEPRLHPGVGAHPHAACATWARRRSGSGGWWAGSCRCSAPSRCTGARPTASRCAPACEVIENGEPLVMFPEGTRRSGRWSRTCSTARPTWPLAPACRWCRSASAGPTRPCPWAPSSSGPTRSCWSWASRSSRRWATAAAGSAGGSCGS